MSLLKRQAGRGRRSGRRVIGVIAGASLLVLGLEAPAFAQPAPVTFTPGSGPTDCVIVVTGANFENPDVDEVTINDVAADFEVQSDTTIWVAANGQTGFIEAMNPLDDEWSSAPTVFQDTTLAGTAGDCGPTITSFTPTCGIVGTPVAITGTNLITHPAVGSFVGADVDFSPFDLAGDGEEAAHTGSPEDPTTLSVNVPPAAQTGRLKAETEVDFFFTPTTSQFEVVTDAALCPDVGEPTKHARSVTLRLRKHLIARGKVSLTDAEDTLTDCVAGVRVKIQRRAGGRWKNVGATTTNDNGGYRRAIKDKPGKYRALAPRLTLNDGADICAKRRSPRQTHRHPR